MPHLGYIPTRHDFYQNTNEDSIGIWSTSSGQMEMDFVPGDNEENIESSLIPTQWDFAGMV